MSITYNPENDDIGLLGTEIAAFRDQGYPEWCAVCYGIIALGEQAAAIIGDSAMERLAKELEHKLTGVMERLEAERMNEFNAHRSDRTPDQGEWLAMIKRHTAYSKRITKHLWRRCVERGGEDWHGFNEPDAMVIERLHRTRDAIARGIIDAIPSAMRRGEHLRFHAVFADHVIGYWETILGLGRSKSLDLTEFIASTAHTTGGFGTDQCDLIAGTFLEEMRHGGNDGVIDDLRRLTDSTEDHVVFLDYGNSIQEERRQIAFMRVDPRMAAEEMAEPPAAEPTTKEIISDTVRLGAQIAERLLAAINRLVTPEIALANRDAAVFASLAVSVRRRLQHVLAELSAALVE